LEDKLCKEGTKDRVTEHSVKLYQEGIEQVKVCISELYFKFREKRSVKEKIPIDLLNTL
jgi:hypothetical protein